MTDANRLAIVVEDEEYLAEIFSETLRGIGLDVRVCRDGEDAILLISRLTPALILLDLHLPKYSGANILTYIRDNARLKDVWVIIASADAVQVADLERSSRLSFNLLTLIKPVSVDQLEQLARRAIGV